MEPCECSEIGGDGPSPQVSPAGAPSYDPELRDSLCSDHPGRGSALCDVCRPWKKYREWVFEPLTYDSIAGLVEVFGTAGIEPAKRRPEELSVRKAEELGTRHVKDYR